MSDSQIDSLGFVADVDDQGSAAAKAVADALQNMGAQADKASAGLDGVDAAATATSTTVSTRLLPSATQLNRMLDDNASQTAKLAAVEAQRQRYLDALTQSQGAATAAGLTYEQAQAKINDRFDAQVAKITGTATAMKAAADVTVVATAATTGHAAALAETSAKLEEHGGILNSVAAAYGVQRYAVVQATDEMHKFFDQIIAGGSPLSAMFYQVPNITNALGGLGNMAKVTAGFLLGPAGLVLGIGAVVAAGAGLAAWAETQQEKLAELSVQLRATRTDAADMATEITAASRSIAAMPGFNSSTARQAATAIGSTYDFSGSGSDIQALAEDAQNLGTVLGTGLKGGLDAVTQALVNPTAEIDALAKSHFPGVDAAMVETVSHLQAAGQQGQAFAVVMGAVHDATAHAHEDALTPWQKAVEDFTEAVKPAAEATKSLATFVGTGILGAATSLLNLLNHGSADNASVPLTVAQQISARSNGGMANGLVTNSTSGAMGMMQIMPANATAFSSQGIDVTTPFGNIQAGMSLLADAYRRTGSVNGALASYGGFVTKDPSGYISKVRANADLSNVDPATQGMILTAAQQYGIPGLAGIGAGLAITESGGKQFANYGGMVNNRAAVTGGATALAGGASSGSSYSANAAAIQAEIEGLQALQATQEKGSEAWTETQQKIDTATGALRNAKSGQDLLTQSMTDSLAPLQAASGYQRTMAEVTNQFTVEAERSASGVVNLTALHGALAAKAKELATAFNDGTDAITKQTASQSGLVDAYGQGAAAVQHVIDKSQAQLAADDAFDKTTSTYTAAVNARTAALDAQAAVQERAKVASQNATSQDQLSLIQAETASVGQNAEARAVLLARMQAELDMHRQFGDVLPAEAQRYIDLQGQIAAATNAYQQQQQSLSDLANGVSGVFSTVGDDISQAFTVGSGSAVNFKNILAGLETQVASLALKFAVINPLMNSLFGQQNTTLGSISSALGGSTALSSGSLGSLFSGSGLSSIGGSLATGASNVWSGLFGGGSQVLTGTTSVVPGLGVSSSALTSVNGLWNGGSALGGFSSLGGILGIGGSVLPGLMSGNYAQAATGGIGAALGTAILPGIGTALGGLAGNLLGGLFGGGHPKNPYTIDNLNVSNGRLALGQSWNQAQSDQITAQAQSDIQAINAALASVGAAFSASGQIGSVRSDPNNKNAALRSTSVSQEIAGIGITSGDATFNQALATGLPSSFDSAQAFATAITQLKAMADAVDAVGVKVSAFNEAAGTVTVAGFGSQYSGDTLTALTHSLGGKTMSASDLSSAISTVTAGVANISSLENATTLGTSSFQQTIGSLTSSYQAAIAQAQQYGLSTDALVAKQKELTDAQYSAARFGLDVSNDNMKVRYYQATGQDEAADLLTHDIKADQDYKDLDASFQAIYGAAWQSADAYETDRTQLVATESAERLAIEQKYQDQATQAAADAAAKVTAAQNTASQSAASTITSLRQYASGLATSSTSPLSAADQYAAARSTFLSTSSAAQGGNATALGNLQSAAQTFLGISQSYNAGGAAFANDFGAVQSALGGVAGLSSDTLTASFYAQQSETQTQTLVDELQSLRGEVVKLQQITRTNALVSAAA